MKSVLLRHAKRIDALSLRERVFLFLSAALVLAALADATVFSPATTERKQLAALTAKQVTELQTLRDKLGGVGHPASADTPQSRLLKAIEQAQQERSSLDRELRARSVSADERAHLPQLLARVLRRHDRLTLMKLTASNEVPDFHPAGSNTLHWQAVDLSISGAYLDLMDYVAELEQAMPNLRWGELRIGSSSSTSQPLMNVRLLLVGYTP